MSQLTTSEGQRRVLSLGTLRTLRAFGPVKISPFMVPTIIAKEAPTGGILMGDTLFLAVTIHFPQAGGTRITEANKVIFESLSSLNSPPIGGLHSFRRDWLKEKYSNNVLNISLNGHVLPFNTKPC